MADDVKKVEVAITSTYDGKGAAQAVVDQEKLTSTGKGLATALPQMEEATKAYTVSTEAEYLAIQKAHDALAARIPVLQAAQKDTAVYTQTLANLSAALSSESALQIAERMETKAGAAAKAEASEAAKADAAGQLEDAEATKVNTVAMREQLVILRELMAGRTSRIPGSLSILAGQYGMGGAGFATGIIAATAAFFALQESIEGVERASKAADSAMKLLEEGFGTEDINAIRKAWDDAQLSEIKYWADLRRNTEDYLKEKAGTEIATAKESYDASISADQAVKDISLALLEDAEKRGVITHAQALTAKYQLDVEYERKRIQLIEQEDATDVAAKQAELSAKQKQFPGAANSEQDAFVRAQRDAEAAAAHMANERAFQKAMGEGKGAMEKSDVTADDAGALREAAEAMFGSKAVSGKPLSDIAHMMRGQTIAGMMMNGTSFSDAWDVSTMFRSSLLGGRSLSGANFAAFEGGEKQFSTAQGALSRYQTADLSIDPSINPAVRAEQSKAQLEDARKSLSDLKKSIDDLTREIPTLKSANSAKDSSLKTSTALSEMAGAISSGASPSTDTLNDLVGAAQDTKATSDQHAAAVAALKDSLMYLGSSAKDINTIVNGLLNYTIDAKQEIESMKSRFDSLANTASQANQWGGFAG
jgi:hypothetical protein